MAQTVALQIALAAMFSCIGSTAAKAQSPLPPDPNGTGFPTSPSLPPQGAYQVGAPAAVPTAVSVPAGWPNAPAPTQSPNPNGSLTLPATILPGNRNWPAGGAGPGGVQPGSLPPGATNGGPATTVPGLQPGSVPGSGPTGVPPTVAAPSKPAGPPPVSEMPSTMVIARVGNEVVLLADILPSINDTLHSHAGDMTEEQKNEIRERMVRKRLEELLQIKMLTVDARRKVPKEGYAKIEEKLSEIFEEKELPRALEKTKMATRADLDAKLREFGGSMDREKRNFRERLIAQDWVRQSAKYDEEVTHEQMLEWYQQHAADYDLKARARWEEIVVRFDAFPTKVEAYRAIGMAGSRVWAGERFADVARAASSGSSASEGGARDWTYQGSLASKVVDQAVFTLPVGQLSPILEDPKSYVIVRVTEREEAGRKPFVEVQAEIKKKIKTQRQEAAIAKLVEDVKARTKIWTVFDAPAQPEVLPGTGLYTPAVLQNLPSQPGSPAPTLGKQPGGQQLR